MLNNQIYVKIFRKSPWGHFEEELKNKHNNIFTRPRKKNFNFNIFFSKFNISSNKIIFFLVTLMIIWLSFGIYEVKEGEQAAVIRFGKFVRIGSPGLNYHFPLPFEQVIIEKINQSRRIEIGYRSGNVNKLNINSKAMVTEATMLTGDENIIALNCDVMWHISDLEKYIFNIVNPEESVKTVAESAIREIIGNTPISSVLSNRKQEITDKIEALTQKILDYYNSGVAIEKVQLLKAEPPSEVIDAYRDVQTSKADKEREINQAQSYNNDILPKARGEFAKLIEEAEGYKQEVISKAQGDTKRFSSVYTQYIMNKLITRERLYLEAIESVFSNTHKIIMKTHHDIFPHMPICYSKIRE